MTDRHPSKRRRRIMREFSLAEISAVDRPAQARAKATIMKRSSSQETDDMDFHKIMGRPASFATVEGATAHLRDMEAAARANPDALEKYRDGGVVAAPVAEKRSLAAQEFDLAVDAICERDGCERHAAMSRARRERPDLYDRMQES